MVEVEMNHGIFGEKVTCWFNAVLGTVEITP